MLKYQRNDRQKFRIFLSFIFGRKSYHYFRRYFRLCNGIICILIEILSEAQVVSNFSQPLLKTSARIQVAIYILKMGKQVYNRQKKARNQVSGQLKNVSVLNPSMNCKQNPTELHFVQFLKEVHQQLSNQNQQKGNKQNVISQVMRRLMDFFNFQRYYTKIELDCYFICLANLFHLKGEQVQKLTFEREFKNKVKYFLQQLNESDQKDAPYHSKIQAVFYILVLFIYQQHATMNTSLKQMANRIFSDKSIIKSILNIEFQKHYRISKLYGVIILQITTKSQSKILKQCLLKSIFCNLKSITHQQTLFNLLVHLRKYKNKVKISLKDVKDGQIIPILIQNYRKHIQKYQSFYVLDYLNHLIFLFPCLARQAMQASFIQFLLENTSPQNMHHPLHEAIIISLLKNGIRFSQLQIRQAIIQNIIKALANTNIYTRIKMAKIIIELQKCEFLIVYMTESNNLRSLIEYVNPKTEKGLLEKILQFMAYLIKRLVDFNVSVSKYIAWTIQSRLQNMKQRHIFKDFKQLQNEE